MRIIRFLKIVGLFIQMTVESFPIMWEKYKQERRFEKANKIDSPKSR